MRSGSGRIEDVLARHAPALMALGGVVGVAQGQHDGRPCIVVYVKEQTPEIERALPNELDGYPVHIHASGEIGPGH